VSHKQETCDYCQEPGQLGPEIRAYSFAAPKGNNVVRFLHASDGGKPCYIRFESKYLAYMAEQRAKKAANG
jgi:hypothetical protein